MSVLVGGVGQLYQGDLDLGRIAIELLAREDLGHDVLVEDFHYGAIAIAQRLQEDMPDSLVLIGAAPRGRAPGSIVRRRVEDVSLPAQRLQEAVEQAATGYVSIDLVLEVASAFDALPPRAVVFEVEPASIHPAEALSGAAEAALGPALDLVRAEVRRSPLLQVADQLRGMIVDDRLEPCGALDAMRELLDELLILDRGGRWGATFALQDRLRLKISAGETGEGMSHLDWGLWWTLIEELDRLQRVEPSPS